MTRKNHTRSFLKCSFVSGGGFLPVKKSKCFSEQNQNFIFIFIFFYFKVSVTSLVEVCLLVILSQVGRTMQKNDRSGDDSQRDSVSRHQLPFPSSISLHYINSSLNNIMKYHAGFDQLAPTFIIKGDMRRNLQM